MDIKPAAVEQAVNRDDPRQADLAQENPRVKQDKARLSNTLHQHLLVGHTGENSVVLPA